VLNKIDRCAEDDLLRAEATIRTRASDVRFVELARQARLDAHLNEFRTQAPGAAREQAHSDGHAHSGLGPHEHGLMTHEHVHEEDPGWLSFVLRSQTAQAPDTLHKALDVIVTHEPVLRVKGFAHVGNAAGLPTICQPTSVNFLPHLHDRRTTNPAHIIADTIT
jgi:cobalamin biosynthesis protein CobW